MKAVISNKIYLETTPELTAYLKQELTYKIVKEVQGSRFSKFSQEEIIKNYTIVSPKIIAIPSGRLDLVPEDYELIDKRVLVPEPLPKPLLELFPEQQEIYTQVEDTCFINAKVGWGKTFTALWVAYNLGQKTLIVTHTTFLRDQWVKEVRKLFGIEASIIGSGKQQIDGPITIANVQTMAKLATKLNSTFGTIILDEAHHCPADTFATILGESRARYKIGLSGTMKRKDGKHIIFRDYFGDKLFQPEENNTLKPTIKVIKTGITLKPGVTWSQKINALLYDEEYQQFIVGIAKLQIQKGHKVLIIASRTEFLEAVAYKLGDRFVPVIGSTDIDDRELALTAIEEDLIDGIAGSRQIFSEGISANRLSSVILAEPISNESNLEQIIGRIQRKHPLKPDPEVIDLWFSGYSERRQNNVRLAFYLEKGWEIQGI